MDILNAGQGRYRGRLNATSGVESLGVPPEMSFITVANSACKGTFAGLGGGHVLELPTIVYFGQ